MTGQRITKRLVLIAATSVSSYKSDEIVAAVQKMPANRIAEYAKDSYEDGLRGEGVAHDVAVRVALDAGIEW